MNSPVDGLGVEKVHVWRGDRHVLKGISLSLQPGQLIHISGPNGSGKTTLLRVACGLLRPEQGAVTWRGQSIVRFRADFQAALAYASHEPALKGDLSALENLHFTVGLKKRTSTSSLMACLERTGVARVADLPARVLSAGQRRRVAMARILAVDASIWLLDEPYTNLDAAGGGLVSSLLEAHVRAGGLAAVIAHQELGVACEVQRLELTP